MTIRYLPEHWTELQLSPREMRLLTTAAAEWFYKHDGEHLYQPDKQLFEDLFEACKKASGKPVEVA